MSDSLARTLGYLQEVRGFLTPGKEGKGKYDYVGKVAERFFKSTPEFERSVVEKTSRKNGWTIRGSWPSSGRQVFDWEFEIWGERGGDVIVKFNIWSAKGTNDGISYRSNVATVDKLVPKFVRWFQARKGQFKKEVSS
jgi:hypothetical protein